MNSKEVNLSVNVATRYAKLNAAINTAYHAIKEVRFAQFEFTFTPAELDLLDAASKLLENKECEANQRAAMEYVLKHQDSN